MITTTEFHNYLIHLNLFRWQIIETPTGFEATISKDCNPNLSDFTQVQRNEDGTWYVRLSKKDIHNEAITKGFFTV